MCFTKARAPKKTEGFGWKIFVMRAGILYSTNCAPLVEQSMPRCYGEWLSATRNTAEMLEGSKPYKTGWTVFENQAEAEYIIRIISLPIDGVHVIRRVEYKHATLVGKVKWCWNAYETKVRQAEQIRISP